MQQCKTCNEQFNPRNQNQSYCSNRCRQKAHRSKTISNVTDNITDSITDNVTDNVINNNVTDNNVTDNTMITQETLERLLTERDEKHKAQTELILMERELRHNAEISKIKAELRIESLESRLKKLEEDIDQEENDNGIGGLKASDLLQAFMTYQSMNNKTVTAK